VPLARLRGRPDVLWRLPRAVRATVDVIRRQRIALVVGNTVRASFYAALAARLARRPFVWHVQDILPPGPFVRFMHASSAAVVAISHAVAGSLPRSEKVRVVPHGVFSSQFRADRGEKARKLRSSWGVPAQGILVGNVARLQPWKGQRDVIAAAEMLRDLEQVYVAMVGGDIFDDARRYEEELAESVRRRGLEGRVIFTGHQEDMPAAFQALDVLVHASDREPFGRVLIEAGAAALPIVAYASGAVEETIAHGSTGLLVPASDVGALAAALRRLTADAALRRRLGRAAREKVCADFDAGRIVRAIESLFTAVLEGQALHPSGVARGLGRMDSAN
jgi:glycosyltransferase involved in cell wall biosynthesis